MNDWHLFWAAIGAGTAVLVVVSGGTAYFVKVSILGELNRFENRFLERLDGRFISSKIFESMISRSDERHDALQKDIEHLFKVVEKLSSQKI